VIGVIRGRKSCMGCPRMTRMTRILRNTVIRVTGVIRAQTLSISVEALETASKEGSSQAEACKRYWGEIRDIQIVQRIPSLHSDCIRIHPARGVSSGVCADRRRRARTGTDGNDLHDKRDLHGAAEPRPLDISRRAANPRRIRLRCKVEIVMLNIPTKHSWIRAWEIICAGGQIARITA
jgi:hypothetical protein